MFTNINLSKSIFLGVIATLLLVIVACGGGDAGDGGDRAHRSANTDIVLAYDGWTGTYLPSYILKAVFEDRLGYSMDVRDQQTIPEAFEAVGSGRADIFVSAWFPIRYSTFDKFPSLVKLGQPYGGKAKDAFEGWMISSDMGREYRVQHVRDLNSPDLAKLLDTDGDGRGMSLGAQLTGPARASTRRF